MTEDAVRELIIETLGKVKHGADDAALAARLRASGFDMPLADLGMDSLDVLEWCMEVEARSGIEIDPGDLVGHSTMTALVGLIAARSRELEKIHDMPQLTPVPRDAPLRLSITQERIWTYCRNPRTSVAYVLGMRDRILGPLDVDVLRDSLSDIVARHEILRTSFTVAGGEPAAIVHPAEAVALPLYRLVPGADPEQAMTALFLRESAQMRDLQEHALCRFALIRVREDEHWLLRICHHILWDAWSLDVLLGELARVYEARRAGKPSPIARGEVLQYADYAAWQRRLLRRDGPLYQDLIAWWRPRLEGAPTTLPPFRRPAPVTGVQPSDGVIHRPIDAELAQGFARLARGEGATPYVVWLAAVVALLAGETGRSDVLIGSYMTHRRTPETQNMIGFFSALTALPFHVDKWVSFRDWVAAVRMEVAAAEAHCDLPVEVLREELRRSGVATPELRMIFAAPLAHGRAERRFGGLTLQRPRLHLFASMPWSFTLELHEFEARPELRATFDAARYDPAGVRRFLAHLLQLAARVAEAPDRALDELLSGPPPQHTQERSARR